MVNASRTTSESEDHLDSMSDPAQELKRAEMLLVAFYRVSGGSTAKVPYEELTIQAWRDFPDVFSLRNHPEFPDASDIHKTLYQVLKPASLIVSLGNKIFRLTDKGVENAEELIRKIEDAPSKPANRKVRLARSEENFIQHAVRSKVYSAWQDGQREKLVDYDARMFFQFSVGTPVEERRRRVIFARETLDKARDLGMSDAADLLLLCNFLVEHFGQLFGEV